MQRNCDPKRKQVEAWQRRQLTDVSAKVVIYEAFVEGNVEAPKYLARTVHDLFFEPKYDEFRPRTIWSLSNAFTSAFKQLDPIPQFKTTATLGEFLETRFSQSFYPYDGALRSFQQRQERASHIQGAEQVDLQMLFDHLGLHMAIPALLMRTSRLSTCPTARWICAALVTSRVKGVTRLSECCSGPRVPAYTLRTPRLSASSTIAPPMPRLAPVIKIVLVSMFITFSWLVRFVLTAAITAAGDARIRPSQIS